MTIGSQSGTVSSFKPPDPIANMIAWYDISDSNTTYSVAYTTLAENGNNVVLVIDKSYNDNDAIAEGANIAGVLNTTGINNMPVIDCNVGNLIFNNPTLFDTITGTSVFIVGTTKSTNNGHPVRVGTGASGSYLLYLDTNIYERLGFTTRISATNSDVGFDTPYVYGVTGESGGNTELFINDAITNIHSSAYGDGYRTVGKILFNHVGLVGEIQIFNIKLSSSDFTRTFNELMKKWRVGAPIAGMIAWYDVSIPSSVYTIKDSVIALNGNDVVQVKDLSFHYNDAIAVGANIAGTLNTSGINALPAISCNLGNLVFDNDSLFDNITGITIFIIGTATSANTGHPISVNSNVLIDNIDRGIYESIGFSALTSKITHSIEYDQTYLYAITGSASSGTTEVYLNSATTSIHTDTYSGNFRSLTKTLFNCVGLIGEIQIFDSKLDNITFKNSFDALKIKWDVRGILGMLAWYDISDSSSVFSVKDTTIANNGDSVVQVRDISNNSNDAIADGASTAGTLNTTGINSMPVISSANASKLIFNNPTLFDTISGITVFIVGNTTSSVNAGHPFRIGTATSTDNFLMYGAGRTIYEYIGFTARVLFNHTVLFGENYVYAITGDETSGTTELYINDATTSSLSGTYGNNYRTQTKRLFGFLGQIGEIQIFDTKLDNTTFQNTFNALKTKWGIA